MYCKRCLAKLPELLPIPGSPSDQWEASDAKIISYASPRPKRTRCPRCFKKFDPGNPKTYLTTLALTPREIAVKIILTTILGFAAAWIVAFFQMAKTSGH